MTKVVMLKYEREYNLRHDDEDAGLMHRANVVVVSNKALTERPPLMMSYTPEEGQVKVVMEAGTYIRLVEFFTEPLEDTRNPNAHGVGVFPR